MEYTGNVFYRAMNKELPVAVKSSGVFITDREGKQYIDASGGPLVVNLGHGVEALAQAAYDQVKGCAYTHPTMFTTEPVEELAGALAAHAPKGIKRFYFLSGGAEANETAIKLARQIHMENGRTEKTSLVARWDSYHGLTLGALSATGRKSFRAPFLPMLAETIHIPAPFCFRCPYQLKHPQCNMACAQTLEDAIIEAGPETVSAFLAETISGAALAAVVPPEGYFRKIREICDKYDVLLILDEILCGLGRCGKWFASEYFDAIPDMVTMGKGLGGGAIAISAVGVQEKHYDAIRTGSGGFVHGGTFSHHNVAAAVGRAVIRILEEKALVQQAAEKGKKLEDKLKSFANHPHVGNIRGRGLLWGVEFVRDKDSSKPFLRSEKFVENIWNALCARGVLAYKSTGFAQGDGDAIIFGPPFIITDEQLDVITGALWDSLDEVCTKI
ncbi:MAG: aspartate aminotransferase family protein [Desulfobacterales bacterium]|nr:MAG: aspartate aminotransferase family protein [Desulfobacterales bacterium]